MAWLRGDPVSTDPAMTTADYTEMIKERAREVVRERRAILDRAGLQTPVPNASMGLACSGGGIRSATISLGIAQVLARKERLLDFDYCSTVSGGGYFGSFLGSLFLPDGVRGPETPGSQMKPPSDELSAKAHFAQSALTDQASLTARNIGTDAKPRWIRHPVRWLREHSRYLAPNGTSDLIAAAAYLIRNWIAMIYVLALPIALAAILLIAASFAMADYSEPTQKRLKDETSEVAKADAAAKGRIADMLYIEPKAPPPCDCVQKPKSEAGIILSPVWLLAAAAAFLGLSVGVSYWLTEYLSDRGSALRLALRKVTPGKSLDRARAWLDWLGNPTVRITLVILSAGAGTVAAGGLWLWLRRNANLWINWRGLDVLMGSAVALTITACIICILAAWQIGRSTITEIGKRDAFTPEIRRILTRWSSDWLTWVLIIAGVATVDTLGLTGFAWIRAASSDASFFAGIATLAAPLGAWIINKLPSWFKDGSGTLSRWIGRYLWTAALVAALALYSLLAVSIHIGIQYLMFGNQQWAIPGRFAPLSRFGDVSIGTVMLFLGGIVGVLFRFTGASQGFINLSSLHAIYASRLTRAYIGGSNMQRLALKDPPGTLTRSERSIMESDPQDQIPIHVYQQTRTAAPIHLINVTLNETRGADKSQMLERDRKGVPLVFAPEGVFMDTAKLVSQRTHFRWDDLKKYGVETLSLGQLCAISGAAASTGMGARTSLGGSLALSFANIRLGYWWRVGRMIQEADGINPRWKARALVWLLGTITYFYLAREMRGLYTRDTAYINISDGGHFENSGAYELLRRNVQTIVVADNGADPRFLFSDMENLVRKARIDLGMAVVVADREEVEALIGRDGAALFLNGSDEDWRARAAARSSDGLAASPKDAAFCLLLKVHQRPWNSKTGAFEVEEKLTGHIVWMKPRLFEGLPVDITGYATEHPSFPQESTGDQFFDEAQWESYRALGYSMMKQLLERSTHKEDILREINRSEGWNIVWPKG
ncbi:hypothetical protein [Sphingobium terrigena]|nr:hypothetical protein [Sphingobium terrigena]